MTRCSRKSLALTELCSAYISRYRKRAPKMEDGKLMLFDYRLVWRSMLNQSGERTLLPCIIPPHTGHIDLIFELGVISLIQGMGRYSTFLCPYLFGVSYSRNYCQAPCLDDARLMRLSQRTAKINECKKRDTKPSWPSCLSCAVQEGERISSKMLRSASALARFIHPTHFIGSWLFSASSIPQRR